MINGLKLTPLLGCCCLWLSHVALALPEHELVLKGVGHGITLFIDLNTNSLERTATLNAAKELGNGFALIPSLATDEGLSPIYKKYREAIDRVTALDARCETHPQECENESQLRSRAEVERLEDQARQFADQHPIQIKKEFIELSEQLQSEHLYVSQLVISGHHETGEDAESSFLGDFIGVHKIKDQALIEIMKRYPAVYGHLIFLGLWGCAGITHHQVDLFATAFPSIQVWAGFYSTAPSGIRPDSSQYLKSVMLHAFDLSENETPESLKTDIKKIDSIHQVYAGLAVRLAHKEPWIYYRKLALSGQVETHLEPVLNGPRCQKYLQEDDFSNQRVVNAYLSGQMNLPPEEEDSDLKNAYFDLSQNYDCYLKQKNHVTPGKVGLLRFYKTYSAKISLAFQDQLKDADQIIAHSPEIQADLSAAPLLKLTHLESTSRPDQLAWIRQLDVWVQKNPDRSKTLQGLSLLLNRYLVDIDMKCVNFLEWHDDARVDTPKPKCILKETSDQFEWQILPDDDEEE